MAGPLSSPQGLRIETEGAVIYDDVNEQLTRRTKIVAVNELGKPMWAIIQAVLRVGLKIGLNMQSKHDLESDADKGVIHWAVVNDGDPFPTVLRPLAEDRSISRDLTNLFDTDGKWFGFNTGRVTAPPPHPVLCFQLTAKRCKIKGKWSMHPVHIVAVEASSNFDDHFVLGLSVFTKGRTNGSVDFTSTVTAFP